MSNHTATLVASAYRLARRCTLVLVALLYWPISLVRDAWESRRGKG